MESLKARHAEVAQLVVHLIRNQKAADSSSAFGSICPRGGNTVYTADSKSAARYMFIVYLSCFGNKHTAGMRVRIPPGVRQRDILLPRSVAWAHSVWGAAKRISKWMLGRVWLKALASKASIPCRVSWVQILQHPVSQEPCLHAARDGLPTRDD